MMKRLLCYIVLFQLSFVVTSFAQQKIMSQSHSTFKYLTCNACHIRIRPSKENPGLKQDSKYIVQEKNIVSLKYKGRNDLVLNDIKGGEYAEVRFPHKKIIPYIDSTGQCEKCHHHSPKGEFPSCVKCHADNLITEEMVTLKAVYHRACLDCHMKENKETNCVICHLDEEKKKGIVLNSQYKKNIETGNDEDDPIIETDKSIYIKQCFSHIVVQPQRIMDSNHSSVEDLKCNSCHSGLKPTLKKPLLNINATYLNALGKKKFQNFSVHYTGRKNLYLNDIKGDYGEVLFPHEKIVHNIGTMENCQNCHHHSPYDKYVKCKSCHTNNGESELISLKAAYHRACVNCHLTFELNTSCSVCHTIKGEEKVEVVNKANIKPVVPYKKLFITGKKDDKYVHFFHVSHSKKYVDSCVNCHQNQACNYCHEAKDQTIVDEVSQNGVGKHEANFRNGQCAKCHDVNDKAKCILCHTKDKNRAKFDHFSIAGWELNEHHEKLNCERCHSSNVKIEKKCMSCHAEWDPENFNHSSVGFVLNRNHNDLYCEFCHYVGFENKPSCIACHNYDVKFPEIKPGYSIKQNNKKLK